jgi:hypothetical protein
LPSLARPLAGGCAIGTRLYNGPMENIPEAIAANLLLFAVLAAALGLAVGIAAGGYFRSRARRREDDSE